MISFKEKIKNLDLKKAIKGFTFIWGLALIVVMTVVNLAIDPSKLDFWSWLSNTLLLLGIMVFGLLMGESIGADKQLEKVGGLYQSNLKEYNDKSKALESIIIFFSQFYHWFKKRELYNKKVNYLINHDIDGNIVENVVKYIKLEHLPELQEHALKLIIGDKEIYIEKQNEQQIEAIRYVLEGKIKVDSPNASYYLNAFENSNCQTELEVGKQIDREIKFNKGFNRTMKIVISVFISLIWATLTVKDFMDAQDAQAWINLVSRITALFTSLLSGWSSSIIDVKLRAKKLKNKYNILTRFECAFNNKEFVPESANELAKKHYEEYIAQVVKEQKEALDSVVLPEVLEPKLLIDSTSEISNVDKGVVK